MIQDKKFVVIDVMRGRLDYPDLLKAAKSQAEKHNPTRVLVEFAGLGSALFQDLLRSGFAAIDIKSQRDKVTRMRAQAAKFEQQQFFYRGKRSGSVTSWTKFSRFRMPVMMTRWTHCARLWRTLRMARIQSGMPGRIEISPI